MAHGHSVVPGVREPRPEAREDGGGLSRPCLAHEKRPSPLGAHRSGVHHTTPVVSSPPVEERAERRRALVTGHALRRGCPEHADARDVIEHADACSIEAEQPVHPLVSHVHQRALLLVPRRRGRPVEKLPGRARQADRSTIGEIDGQRWLVGWTGGEVREGAGHRGGEGRPRTAQSDRSSGDAVVPLDEVQPMTRVGNPDQDLVEVRGRRAPRTSTRDGGIARQWRPRHRLPSARG